MSTPDSSSERPATDSSTHARNPAPLDDSHVAAQTAIDDVKHTRTRATFIGWVVGAIITILLLIFILANLGSQQINFLFAKVDLPVGVSLLIAAIAGALITAMIGGARTFQLNRALKKARKAN
ncbi:LapA family protein [Gordonia sp. L191]|uniref:LapA family protein n=1 Tax=Gordonia TaxID=2053 RepID=UPI001AD788FD|nr:MULTISPECIES: LapA family protein [Gordonia]QTI66819.1 LapA family protein [Gordonia polyisoprenivorans]WHU49821.1 LapA family protein [Gordonia sp. L191]